MDPVEDTGAADTGAPEGGTDIDTAVETGAEEVLFDLGEDAGEDTVEDVGDEPEPEDFDRGDPDPNSADILKDKNGLFLGKYKTLEEAAKGHRELEKTLREKGWEPPPDNYDIETAFKEAGIVPHDRNDPEAAKVYESFEGQLREQRFNQKQLNWLTKFGNEWVQAQMHQYMEQVGPKVDIKAEQSRLKEEWGDKTEARMAEIKNWASANLPKAVLTRPLNQSAEGVKFLLDLMKRSKGPVPIQSGRPAQQSNDELEEELAKLMQDADYFSGTPRSDVLQKRARQISAKLAK